MTAMKRPTVISKEFVLGLLLTICGVVFIFVTTMSDTSFSQAKCYSLIQQSVAKSYDRLESLLTSLSSSSDSGLRYSLQRNDLSRQLNEAKKLVGQLSCREIGYRRKLGQQTDDQVSMNGGWCAEDSTPGSPEHKFDQSFASALDDLLEGKKVGSFGEGPGAYRTYFLKTHRMAGYVGYDGAPFCELTTKGMVKFLDLTAPQFNLPAFDWVLSVEVGEHIPAKFEAVYIDNLARHAKEGIVLSWAPPGQEGHSHVNTKPLEDVIAVMSAKGFNVDDKAGDKLRQAAQTSWLKKNLQVFRRKDPQTFLVDDI